jgi:hypothetical protein
MRILERLRNRSLPEEAGAPGSTEASSADEQRLPIARYDQLSGKQLIPQLSQLAQVELAAVEGHERSHRARPVVLNRLRWLRGNQPLPGYDTLDPDEIIHVLADSDAATVKAVRSYEGRHRNRREVLAQAARVHPTARASAEQVRAREERAALVKAGIRSDRRATWTGLAGPDRIDARREERNELERLRDEARYRRERLDLYRARLYGRNAAHHGKLRELERAFEGASARLRRAEAAAQPTHPPT